MPIKIPKLKRLPGEQGKLVVDPSSWIGGELLQSESWVHEITREEIQDVENATHNFELSGVDMQNITREHFCLQKEYRCAQIVLLCFPTSRLSS